MRVFLTSLMAFVISGLAGGMIAQVIAERTNAGEEFILAFMASALVTLVTTGLFFIAQLFSDQARAVSVVGRVLAVIMLLIGVALLLLTVWGGGLHVPTDKESWFLIGLVLPGLVTVLVHWWFVRWRVRRTPQAFGRGN